MPVTTLPLVPDAGERPRERFAAFGVGALTDAELIALVLGSGAGGRSALQLARSALDRCGGLAALVTRVEGSRVTGFGPARHARLAAGIEIARRSARQTMQGRSVLTSPEAVRDYLRLCLRTREHEVFVALFLDSQHRLLADEELFRGTLSQTSVYPREVVKAALSCNAAAVIFAHNHPSGVAEPSRADEMLTRALVGALATIDVRTLDHFVVAGAEVVSFAERGLL